MAVPVFREQTAAAGRRGAACTTRSGGSSSSRADEILLERRRHGPVSASHRHNGGTAGTAFATPGGALLLQNDIASANRPTRVLLLELRHARRLLGQGSSSDDAYNVIRRPVRRRPRPRPQSQPWFRSGGGNFFFTRRVTANLIKEYRRRAARRHRLAATKAQLQPSGSGPRAVSRLRSGWLIHNDPREANLTKRWVTPATSTQGPALSARTGIPAGGPAAAAAGSWFARAEQNPWPTSATVSTGLSFFCTGNVTPGQPGWAIAPLTEEEAPAFNRLHDRRDSSPDLSKPRCDRGGSGAAAGPCMYTACANVCALRRRREQALRRGDRIQQQ